MPMWSTLCPFQGTPEGSEDCPPLPASATGFGCSASGYQPLPTPPSRTPIGRVGSSSLPYISHYLELLESNPSCCSYVHLSDMEVIRCSVLQFLHL